MTRPLASASTCLTLLLTAGALTGCGKADAPAPANTVAAASETPAEGYAERIRQLPEGQRSGVFLRAIRDGKEQCQEVTKEYEIGAIEGRPTWAVTCDGTTPWVISIDGNGVARVTKASPASRLPPKGS
ncbi:hypothetical protein GCM10011380_18870 [Sphingomonas metalli]|uniref:Lipoprotein n=1 Tax=Sphingomonas metalli TaxID=1779358 RepID=A0A916T5N3_9SPHN|nr:hypothetical protein [Sphingomonas metalli]GGB29563.1 hypothetical protein GCM10011380_18870 [Sphingomonas metalli]